MKKLTLKQVALGLLIAGYSISGAYAADTVSTKTDFILGHAPLVNSTIKPQSFTKNSVDIKVLDASNNQIADNAAVKNGYTIQLTYKVADQDGDTDPDQATANTVKFAYMKRNTTDYIWVTAGSPTTGANGEVTVSWKIPAAAIGSKIYYAVIPKTKYGNPNQSTKEVYGNVFKSADAGSRDVTQTGTNIPNDGVDSGTGGQTPIVPDDTIKPNENTFAIKIYEATINNGEVAMNTELNASSKPEVGKTYAAKVILTQTGTQDITTQFKYTWSLVDFDGNKIGDHSLTSQPVDNVQASTVNYQDDVSSSAQAVTNIAYTIPVNDQVKKADGSAVTGLFAGAQGYKLQVEAEAL